MKIALIFYSYYNSIDENLKKIDLLIQALPCYTELYLITDKSYEKNTKKNYKIITLDITDNLLDISAYYFGLKIVNESKFDLFVCFNESTFRKYPYKIIYDALIKKLQLLKEINIPLISGIMHKQINLYTHSDGLLNMPYISTFFIVLNRKSYNIFEETYLATKKNQYSIDSIFNEFLEIHLFKTSNYYSWQGKSEKKILIYKRLTVIFERLLSLEIAKNGLLINLIDSTKQKYLFRLSEFIIKWLSKIGN